MPRVGFFASKNSTITASGPLLGNSLSTGDGIAGTTGWFHLDVGQVPQGRYYIGWLIDIDYEDQMQEDS